MALLLLVLILPAISFASPTEASGTVTNVVDGDTFDLRIEDTDPRIIYEIERVRLADVDSPEMSTPEGPLAKAYTTEALLGQKVWLDIDNKSDDGRGPYDRLICVVYLEDTNITIVGKETTDPSETINRSINVTHPFNRLLVDAGFAVVKDFTNNEFDPLTWWENETSNYMFEKATGKGVGYKNAEMLILAPSALTSTSSGKFVGSTKSDKYHYPSCRWAKKILPQNEIWFASSEEARAAGYVPCGVCKPS